MIIPKSLSPLAWARLAILLVCAVGYGATVARTVSFWDCGEFIAGAHLLGIPHPPGTPLFMLVGRVMDIVLGWLLTTALAVNLLSAISSALACLVIVEITFMASKDLGWDQRLRAALAFMAASLAAFSETFWFNAVEAEVYGLAMLGMLVGVWTVFKWDDSSAKNRPWWMAFHVYLCFLGTGVHTYSMLIFPASWLFFGWRMGYLVPKKYLLGLLGVGVVAMVWFLIFPWHFGMLSAKLVFALPSLVLLGLGYRNKEWSNPLHWLLGLFLMSVVFLTAPFLVGLAIALPLAILVAFVTRSTQWSHVAFILLVAAMGYSVQLYLPIRSSTNPVMDENNPENWDDFRASLERRQYGSMGMLERAFYRRGDWSSQLGFHNRIGYLGYHLNQWMDAPLGAQEPNHIGKLIDKPSAAGVVHFLHRIVWELVLVLVLVLAWGLRKQPRPMLIAGLFVLSSLGLSFYVNFSDGTRPDSSWAKQWYGRMAQVRQQLGDKTKVLPSFPRLESMANALQQYQAIPPENRKAYLEGPAGIPLRAWIAWDNQAKQKGIRLPMPPGNVHMEVRERDYFHTPAFLFFPILTVLVLGTWLTQTNKKWMRQLALGLAATAWLLPFVSHYKAHDRSTDQMARDFAYNILQSVPPNGFLFTYGDNDTFPLWYMQMVEKFRTDVVVINTSLANMRWYQEQVLAHYPDLKIGMTLDDLWSRIGKQQLTPRLPIENDSSQGVLLSNESTWRPGPEQMFSSQLLRNHWPTRPATFMFNASLADFGNLAPHLPTAGLVRVLGMSEDSASSNLVHNVALRYRYTNLEYKDWKFQEATRRTIAGYRYLLGQAAREKQHHTPEIQTRLLAIDSLLKD